jgi:hypothetical protein
MSKYRCPICGAVHKQYQPNCRLCGQSLSGENIPVSAPKAATAIGTNTSIKGIIWLGILVVLVLLVGAVFFGYVQSNRAIETAKEVVLQQNTDGWSPLVCATQGASTEATPTCTVPEGQGFTVELPGDRTKSNTPFTLAEGQKMETWSATVSDDTLLEVIFAPVAETATPTTTAAPADGEEQSEEAKEMTALKAIGDEWLKTKGLSRETNDTGTSDVKVTETSFKGHPAVIYTTPTTDVTINGKDAYLQTMLVLRNDVLFVVQTTSIYENAEQFDRMRQTLVFT